MILRVSGITKKRAGFAPLSFTLAEKEGLLLRGRNGAGKTTLLDLIAAIIKPDSGSIEYAGSLGYAMQNPGFYKNLSCYDNLLLEANIIGFSGKKARDLVYSAASDCLCGEFLKKPYAALSAGMKAKMALASALLGEPELILLDEPFNAMDTKSEEIIRGIIKKRKDSGAAIVIAAHGGDYNDLCERTIQL